MRQKIKKLGNSIVKNLKWIILFLGIILFLAIVEDVFDQEIRKVDMWGYQFIATFLISDLITPIAKFVTKLGGAITLTLITIILLLGLKNKKIGLLVALNLIISTGLNLLLKNIVQRPRPNEFRLIDETGYSFPSGHSMVSMAFYGFLIYLIYKFVKSKRLKWTLMIVLSILIITIGISRIYLGVHYTSDVLAGFTISVSYLIIYTSIVKKFIWKREEKDEVKK
ncbi:MAG: phosphatase PAP2 family protein [Clostridia bacterium]